MLKGADGSPSACVITRRAADMYWSRNDGDYLQNAGNVIEAVAHVVRGKQRCGVNTQRQNVLDRIGVFGPIQAVHGHAARIGVRCRRLVERVLSQSGKGLYRSSVRLTRRSGIIPPRSFRTALSQIFASFEDSPDPSCRTSHSLSCCARCGR